MGREFELKYALNPSQYTEIKGKFAPFRPIQMETTYYDTPDETLSEKRWTLRRRLENGVSVCTLKTPLPDGSKGEWETVCEDILDAVPRLIEKGAPEALSEVLHWELRELCGAMFTRLARDVTFGSSRIELALDKGFLFKGEHVIPLLELEAELKDGQDSDAIAFGEFLAGEYRLHIEKKSKFKRAKSL